MMERVLITGGSGFIGTALVLALRRFHPQIAINILDLAPPSSPDVEYIRGSVLEKEAVERAIRGCTHVVHMAAMVGVSSTERDPDSCRLVNEEGTLNVLSAAYRAGVKRLLFTSSSEVYGDQPIQPIAETCQPRPKSIYALSKLRGEEYVRHYRETWGQDWRVVRFFNIYGPGQRAEFVIPRFVAAVAREERPIVYGPGTQVRSFCYVDDAVRCCALALFADGLSSWIFNVGNGSEPITMAELAEQVIAHSGLNLTPAFVSFSGSDRTDGREIWNRIPDVKLAARVLGFHPEISLAQGLRLILADTVRTCVDSNLLAERTG
jgi:UDP-glucose 4-epimerase